MSSGKIESIKQRLRNVSKKQNRQFNDVLQMYFLERFLYRLSLSKYNKNFVLKGGILLYAIFDENYTRKTTDIDLLAQQIDNDATKFNEIIKEICLIETNDQITFDINGIKVKNITEFKEEYHGINVFIPAYLDRTQGRINIDVGFGDIIYPSKTTLNFPTLLDDDLKLYAYSIETIIAEKLEAMASLGMLNSRLKDFYDIYVLSITYDFNGETLYKAIIETFNHRKTKINNISAFDDEFISPYRKGQWNSFIKNKSPNQVIELKHAISCIKVFIIPVLENNVINKKWNHLIQEWIVI